MTTAFMDFKHLQPKIFIAVLLLLLASMGQLMANTQGLKDQADRALFEQAHQLSLNESWAQAESLYRQLIDRHDDWPEPKNNLAILLFKTSRIDEAKLMLEQAVMASSAYRTAHNNRAALYNYLASQAYSRALGKSKADSINEPSAGPQLRFIADLQVPQTIEKVIEKTIEVVVEKPVVVEKIVEKIVEKRVEVEVPAKAPVVASVARQNVNANSDKLMSKPPMADYTQVRMKIEQQLSDWLRAWSDGDFEAYIAFYSTEFVPSDQRKSFAEWKNIRRARLRFSNGVKVNFDELRVFLEGQKDYALIEFVQFYQSSSYSDEVLKQLYLRRQQGKWRILSERIIKTY